MQVLPCAAKQGFEQVVEDVDANPSIPASDSNEEDYSDERVSIYCCSCAIYESGCELYAVINKYIK